MKSSSNANIKVSVVSYHSCCIYIIRPNLKRPDLFHKQESNRIATEILRFNNYSTFSWLVDPNPICESWTVKKAERQKIDAFELWCWRRLLRVPWTARTSNQSILKEISPGFHWKDWCWSWNSNTLAISWEEPTHWKRPWWWEGLGAGGEGDNRGWDGWMASPTRWAWVWVNSGSWVMGREAWRAAIHGVAKSRTRLNDWTELNWTLFVSFEDSWLPWKLDQILPSCIFVNSYQISTLLLFFSHWVMSDSLWPHVL